MHGELLTLGIRVAASTVRETLHEAGIAPAPDRHGTPKPVAATSDAAATPHLLWHQAGDGPCLAAIRDRTIQKIPDLLHDSARTAINNHIGGTTAVGSAVVFPLRVGPDVLGALLLTARSPRAFATVSLALGTALSTHTALALVCAAGRERNTDLTQALQTSRLTGMAVGIVMTRQLLTPEQAFDELRRYSQRHNRKLRELAADIVTTGEVPGE